MSTVRTILDIHVLQTVPPSNINRDDTGSPKTATYGGTRRARVSSQAWKRATRLAFEKRLDATDLGVRTKRVVELVAADVSRLAPDLAESAEAIAGAVLSEAGIKLTTPKVRKSKDGEVGEQRPDESGYLIFLANRQIAALASAGVDAARSEGVDGIKKGLDKKKLKAVITGSNSIDVALFGRMVADVADYNVDAAAQVAHAISVHPVDIEFDYFTAVDDQKFRTDDEDAGAGMIGTVEFNSSTLYRYATVDVDALLKNLGDVEAARRAVEAFIDAFTRSMPTGKQNTFANRTLPDGVVVALRSDQSVSLVGAFEEAVEATGDMGRLATAAERLATYSRDLDEAFGTPPEQAWVTAVRGRVPALESLGEAVSLTALVTAVGEVTAARLADQA